MLKCDDCWPAYIQLLIHTEFAFHALRSKIEDRNWGSHFRFCTQALSSSAASTLPVHVVSPRSQVMLRGHGPRPCSTLVFHGHVPWSCTVVMSRGHVPRPCSDAIFRGHVVSCEKLLVMTLTVASMWHTSCWNTRKLLGLWCGGEFWPVF